MFNYLVRRLLVSIPTLVGVTILIFLVMNVLPGDPVTAMLGGQEEFHNLSEEDQERFRADLGLDRPLHIQYLSWMGDIARGDFGRSFWREQTVRDLIVRRGPITAQIALMSVALAWSIGIPIGILSAARRNSWQDQSTRVFATLFLAIPNFWLGVLIILVAVLYFSWRPPVEINYLWDDPVRNLQLTLGPAFALATGASAYIARMTRSAMLEVLHSDYVRTARAKGLATRSVLMRHAFRNAILPVITLSGLMLAGLLGGSVAVEGAFSVPGLGSALVRAVSNRDFMVVQNIVLLYAATFTVVNLAVDLTYSWLDPRIKYS